MVTGNAEKRRNGRKSRNIRELIDLVHSPCPPPSLIRLVSMCIQIPSGSHVGSFSTFYLGFRFAFYSFTLITLVVAFGVVREPDWDIHIYIYIYEY